MKRFFTETYLHIRSLKLVKKIRGCVSPLFLVMVLASALLWYISKLSHTYTTELRVKVQIESEELHIDCVVEGVGTNLIGYKIKGGGRAKITPSEIKFDSDADSLTIDPSSLLNAISLRFSDIKIISIERQRELKISSPKK